MLWLSFANCAMDRNPLNLEKQLNTCTSNKACQSSIETRARRKNSLASVFQQDLEPSPRELDCSVRQFSFSNGTSSELMWHSSMLPPH